MTVASPPAADEADEVVVKLVVATNSPAVAVEVAVDEVVVALGQTTLMPL